MVHHGMSARNEVGQAFLPVYLARHPRLATAIDFPFVISHFSFFIAYQPQRVIDPVAGGTVVSDFSGVIYFSLVIVDSQRFPAFWFEMKNEK